MSLSIWYLVERNPDPEIGIEEEPARDSESDVVAEVLFAVGSEVVVDAVEL